MPEYFDTHAHLDEEKFNEDRDEVIARAIEANVTKMLTIGTSLQSSLTSIELAEKHEGVFAAVGIHPNYTKEAQPGDWEQVKVLVDHPQVIAVGETGLDRHWDFAPIELQQDYFQRHLVLSRESQLPFIVHCREADADVMEMLVADFQANGPLNGILHSFVGSTEMAAECLKMGMYISYAGMVTFKKSVELRETAATIPLDRLLIETDSPYLSPVPKRGKRNEPSHVIHTCECLAEVHQLSTESLAQQTFENANRLFQLG